jgi:hypothetical protein
MEVPLKPSTVDYPGGQSSAAGLTMPVVKGTGLATLGQDVSGVANLAPYFAHAQSIRDAQQAKLDQLQAHIDTDTQIVGAQQRMQAWRPIRSRNSQTSGGWLFQPVNGRSRARTQTAAIRRN